MNVGVLPPIQLISMVLAVLSPIILFGPYLFFFFVNMVKDLSIMLIFSKN